YSRVIYQLSVADSNLLHRLDQGFQVDSWDLALVAAGHQGDLVGLTSEEAGRVDLEDPVGLVSEEAGRRVDLEDPVGLVSEEAGRRVDLEDPEDRADFQGKGSSK